MGRVNFNKNFGSKIVAPISNQARTAIDDVLKQFQVKNRGLMTMPKLGFHILNKQNIS